MRNVIKFIQELRMIIEIKNEPNIWNEELTSPILKKVQIKSKQEIDGNSNKISTDEHGSLDFFSEMILDIRGVGINNKLAHE